MKYERTHKCIRKYCLQVRSYNMYIHAYTHTHTHTYIYIYIYIYTYNVNYENEATSLCTNEKYNNIGIIKTPITLFVQEACIFET
jgi:hypothetical protein